MLIRSSSPLISLVTLLILISCSSITPPPVSLAQGQHPVPIDPFTYAEPTKVKIKHIDLDLTVSFEDKTLHGSSTLQLDWETRTPSPLVLDTNDLDISHVEALQSGDWTPVKFSLGPDHPLLGSRLTIDLKETSSAVRISYATDPGASGLQWLAKEQTGMKTAPFLYSQAQAIHARSMVPLQDTPSVRFTYSARIRTPKTVLAVMSAEQDPSGERDGDYVFQMPQPIPSYLLAIAVGDLAFQPVSDVIGVYGEGNVASQAAREFEDTPQMIRAAEPLYGPYRWGRYDMIVLPPSFPYGGMENPRVSFMTPTLLAGDKSLTNVVAHELAHSWSGNLVTNATWRDAWLNEGFTSYVENRLMEAIYGKDRAVMEQVLALEDLKRNIAEMEDPALTSLKLPATLETPDDAFSQVAYVKGQYFLMFLEQRFGRNAFDAYLRSYFDNFAFQSITTEDFIAHFSHSLWKTDPSAVTETELNEWIYGTGLPQSLRVPTSNAFTDVDMLRSEWESGSRPLASIPTRAWSTHEWLRYVNFLSPDLTEAQFSELDLAFGLSTHHNAEIAFAWYMKAIRADYREADTGLREFLINVGRGKFIYRLYEALIDIDRGDWARAVYQQARPGYHPIAQSRIDQILLEE